MSLCRDSVFRIPAFAHWRQLKDFPNGATGLICPQIFKPSFPPTACGNDGMDSVSIIDRKEMLGIHQGSI
jgi:hypothetical protein